MAARVVVYDDVPGRMHAQVQAALRIKAARAFDYAKATAPVDTGHYRNSITLAELPLGWRITANADYSVYVEFGTRKMAAYHTLGVALDAAKG